MKLCPHSRTVHAVYRACTLRYSDESFSIADLSIADVSVAPHVELTPYLTRYYRDTYESWHNGVLLIGYVVDTASMNQMRFELIRRLTVKASQAAERIAEGTDRFTDTQWVRAVVQCTRDLLPSECTHGLSNYTDQLPRLFPNNSGGAIKGYTCYLGYAILADRPSSMQLDRYRYSESYAREMSAEELERMRKRRKVAIIVGLTVGSVAVVIFMISLLVWFLLNWWRRRIARLEHVWPSWNGCR
ncbi:cysteine-rich receptor-like protein kinase 26 [Lolium rigidum]|uniref:cysteine-rich receptor-like protein kinase 26 n=1 Tax=Lolium rigidum TaxID=89674 RepID=UPI001F5DA4EB|nr:cysteine-rich receptor-like protein kinase 26 [Lolium rigidum]